MSTALGSTSARGAEPILTLAMVDYSSFSKYQLAIARDYVISETPSLPVPPKESSKELQKESPEDTFSFASVTLHKSQPSWKNPLVITRSHQHPGLFGSASLQAGFGDIFSDKPASIYGRNGTAWEEPACGYLMLRFRF